MRPFLIPFVVLLSAFGNASTAQITFDRSYFETQVGNLQSSVVYQMDASQHGSLNTIVEATGGNQTYDFSPYTYSFGANVSQPILNSAVGTPGENDPDFGGANFVQYLDYGEGSGFWSYYDLSDEGYDYIGSYYLTPAGTQVNKNQPHDRFWQFPLTAGSMWDQSIVVHTVSFGTELTTNITETNVVDGWGMLITPMGSAPCIRLRKTRVDEIAGKTAATNDTYFFLTNGNLSASITYFNGTISLATYSVLSSVGTAVEEVPVPSFALDQNYPNPFSGSTTISFDLAKPAYAELGVYDIMGRQVASLVNGTFPAGSHQARLTSDDLSDGLYVYRLSIDGMTTTRTLTVLKQ